MAAKDISIIIPVSTFGYFVKKTFENIAETCGYNIRDIDIVYVHAEKEDNNRPTFLNALEDVKKRSKSVRVVQCPHKFLKRPTEEFHEIVIWLIQNDDKLRKWCLLQHNDLLWTKPYWLPFLENVIKSSKKDPNGPTEEEAVIVAVNDHKSLYCVDHRPIPRLVDWCLFFNRKFIVGHNLVRCFQRGGLKSIGISDELRSLFRSNRVARYSSSSYIKDDTDRFISIKRDHSWRWIDENTWVDGVQALSLEFYKYLDKMTMIPIKHRTIHIGGVITTSNSIIKDGDILRVNVKIERISEVKWFCYNLVKFAYMTSMIIPEDDSGRFLLPISTMFELASKLRHARDDWREVFDSAFNSIKPFIDINPPYRVFGPRPNPIRKVIFDDKEIQLK